MARLDWGRHQQIFEIDTRNNNGPREPKTTKHPIHQQKGKSKSENEDITPQRSGESLHLVFAVVLDQVQIYTDLMGTFPARSSKRNHVIMVCYSYDANYIMPISMTSNSGVEWDRAFRIVFGEMTSKGFKPNCRQWIILRKKK
jgi:hypothetical protein